MTPTIVPPDEPTKRVGRPSTLPHAVRKTITLDKADVVYVETHIGRNFSEAVRRLIEDHRRAAAAVG